MFELAARRLLAVLFASALVGSCGGGTDGGGTPEDTLPEMIDTVQIDTPKADLDTAEPPDTLPDTLPETLQDTLPDLEEPDTEQPDFVFPDTAPEVSACPAKCNSVAECQEQFPSVTACQQASCEFDAECGKPICKLNELPFPCCVNAKDCPQDNPCSLFNGCVANKCSYSPLFNKPECCQNLQVENVTFEGGLPSSSKLVLADSNEGDPVTWSVQDNPCGLGKALYLGNPQCQTYYNGSLLGCLPVNEIDCTVATEAQDCPGPNPKCHEKDKKCIPAVAPTSIVASATLTEVNLPKDAWTALTFRLWLDSEPDAPDSEIQFDVLRLQVFKNGKVVDMPFSSVGKKSTDGKCINYSVDLSALHGSSVDLKWEFKADNFNNNFKGFYLDDLVVRTYCKDCTKASDCNDNSTCTADECVLFPGDSGRGLCVNQKDDPFCATCGKDADCVNAGPNPGNPCWVAQCVTGLCKWSPNPSCCNDNDEELIWTDGFEVGYDSPWAFTGDQGSNTTWSVVEGVPNGDEDAFSIYFGDVINGNFNCGLDNCVNCKYRSCAGSAISPDLDLRGVDASFNLKVSFNVKMSTEWDGVAADKYPANNAHSTLMADVLFLEVLSAGGTKITEVWNSDLIKGSTNGVFVLQWADLTQFLGQKVKLRFRFDSGVSLPSKNDGAGIWVDEVSVQTVCDRVCLQASDCGAAPACHNSACRAGACRLEAIPGCCTADFNSDCNDGDACTLDTCNLGTKACSNVFAGDPKCCHAYTDILALGFDSQDELSNGKTAPATCGNTECDGTETCDNCALDCGECPVRWQLGDKRRATGLTSLYFGSLETGTYANGNKAVSDEVVTPAVKIPLYGVPVLDFKLWLDTEHTETFELFVEPVEKDLLSVLVQKKDAGSGAWGTPVTVWTSNSWDFKGSTYDADAGAPVWRQVSVGMKNLNLGGTTVRFVLRFDSVDETYNGYEGAYVDDLKVRTLCQANYECLSPVECPEAKPEEPACTIEICELGLCRSKSNASKEGCCIQETIDSADWSFDTVTLQGWVPKPSVGVVIWRPSILKNSSPGGSASMYFGNNNNRNYEDPGKVSKGYVTSPEVDISGHSKIEVSFKLWMKLQDQYWFSDVLTFGAMNVLVSGGEPITTSYAELWRKPCSADLDAECQLNPVANPCSGLGCQDFPWGQWVEITRTIDLTKAPYNTYGLPDLPKLMVFRFSFDSGDASTNKAEGVFIDDFMVRTVCGD